MDELKRKLDELGLSGAQKNSLLSYLEENGWNGPTDQRSANVNLPKSTKLGKMTSTMRHGAGMEKNYTEDLKAGMKGVRM